MKQPIIAIDFGTTNSVVCTLDEPTGNPKILLNSAGYSSMPSVVYFENDHTVVVGQAARHAQIDSPQQVVEYVKRYIGTDYQFSIMGRDFSAIAICAFIFRKLKADAEATLGGISIQDAVITCPVYFGAIERESLLQAASLAGLNVLSLINEPTAAALAFREINNERVRYSIVIHLGGGTFNVSILRFGDNLTIEVVASNGRAELGGRDFDDAIVKLAIEAFREKTGADEIDDPMTLASLRQDAEKVKRQLSVAQTARIRLHVDSEHLLLEINRAQFEAAIQTDIELMRTTIVNTLYEASLMPDDIHDIFLTGGSTFTPAVRQMVEDVFGKAPNTQVNPIEAAALGAGLYAGKLLNNKASVSSQYAVADVAKSIASVQDILTHSIGITVQRDSGNPTNHVVLARGQILPVSANLELATASNGQSSISISINEGEGDELAYVRHIADFEHKFTSPKSLGYPVGIKFLIDTSGILTVVVSDAEGKQEFQYIIRDKIHTLAPKLLVEEGHNDLVVDSHAETPTTNRASGTLSDIKTLLKSVQFSLYHPKVVEVNSRSGLFLYAHLQQALPKITEDIERFKAELGGEISQPKVAKNVAKLSEGTMITVVPESDEVEFEPSSLTKKWRGDWTRFDFEFRPSGDLENDAVFVRVSIQVANLEIAHIKCAIDVAEETSAVGNVDNNVINPLAQAKLSSQSTTPYQRIFISYSRKDLEVARTYKAAQIALGNEVFLDVDNLRTGQDWKAQLARAIDEADILQLFWSENSSTSEYCQYEWDYALKYRCAGTKCVDFIRPVYWKNPLPPPPERLSHLNFRFASLETEKNH